MDTKAFTTKAVKEILGNNWRKSLYRQQLYFQVNEKSNGNSFSFLSRFTNLDTVITFALLCESFAFGLIYSYLFTLLKKSDTIVCETSNFFQLCFYITRFNFGGRFIYMVNKFLDYSRDCSWGYWDVCLSWWLCKWFVLYDVLGVYNMEIVLDMIC